METHFSHFKATLTCIGHNNIKNELISKNYGVKITIWGDCKKSSLKK